MKIKYEKGEKRMLEYEVRIKNGLWRAKETVKSGFKNFFTTEEGDTNLISIVIVLVIVLALAVVFRKNIASLVNKMWEQIFKDATSATKTTGTQTQFAQ